MKSAGSYYVGVDLGGTKILSVVYDDGFNRVSKDKTKTAAQDGSDAILEKIVKSVSNSLDKVDADFSAVKAAGITVPGVFSRDTGVVYTTPNLPFEEYPLKERLQDSLHTTVRIENDVNAGTYGEYRKGAASGYRCVIGLFPGTGIGGGLILNGELYTGATGNAGEIGHTIIQADGPLCGCGKHGCLESLASRSAIARDAVFLASNGSAPAALEYAGTDFKSYTSKTLARSIEGGDAAVQEIIDRSAYYLGIGMANCVNILNPEIFVIGGGLVDRFGDRYIQTAAESMRSHAMEGLVADVRVVQASLGDYAAVIGAALLAREEIEGEDS